MRGAPFSPASCASLIALRQPRVPDRSLREHDQVLAGRIGDPVRRLRGAPSVSSAPNTVGQAERARRFGEAHHAVEPVVVGDRERGQPEPRRFLDQLLGMARPVEEREIRMTVQLGVRVHAAPSTRLAITVSLRREVLPARPPTLSAEEASR